MRRIETTNGKRIQTNGHENLVRLSGKVTPVEKTNWFREIVRAAKIDGIRDPNSGTFLARIINMGLRLDTACLSVAIRAQSEYLKAHKRRRDEDPARV